jgi:hypothetical protein
MQGWGVAWAMSSGSYCHVVSANVAVHVWDVGSQAWEVGACRAGVLPRAHH